MDGVAKTTMTVEEFVAGGADALSGAAAAGGIMLTKDGRPYMHLVPVDQDGDAPEEAAGDAAVAAFDASYRRSMEDLEAGRIVSGDDLLAQLTAEFEAAFPHAAPLSAFPAKSLHST